MLTPRIVTVAQSAEKVSTSIWLLASAVERVTGHGPNLGEIDVVDAVADLFVASEADSHGPMLDFRMFHEPLGGFHDDGHARFIVGPEQGRAVAGDDRAALKLLQFGIFGHADHFARIARQDDVAAAIILNHLGFDVFAGGLRRGIHVRTEGEDRGGLVDRRRDCC